MGSENGADYQVQVGTCLNRWYDKLQILVCGDGSAGVNFEHSAIDGHTALRVASDIFAETVISFARTITKTVYADDKGICPSVLNAPVKRAANVINKETGNSLLCTRPKKLHFYVPQSACNKIFYAETALGDQILACDICVLEFQQYGKQLIVRNKLSPDAFVQLSILLAYYRLYGTIVCVYESVLTKNFLHGRTEAMRTATPQAASFCRTFCDSFATKEEKLSQLRIAIAEHSRLVKEASSGKGVDRHLFALKCIAKKHSLPLPPFFQCDAYQKLNHCILSTSNCGNPSLRLFGFGPVVQDGFGIGYIIRDFGLQFSISSKHRQTKRFVNMFNLTLMQLGSMMENLDLIEIQKARRASLTNNEVSLRNSSADKQGLQHLESYDMFGESEDIAVDTLSSLKTATPVKDIKFVGSVKRMDSVSQQVLNNTGEGVRLKDLEEVMLA